MGGGHHPVRLEGCTYLASCCFPVVLMDQAAETIATTHGALAADLGRRRLGYGQLKAAVGSVRVVMRLELPKDSLQVASAENQEVVEALPPGRPHPSFGVGVSPRGSDRRLDNPYAFGPEDVVERT